MLDVLLTIVIVVVLLAVLLAAVGWAVNVMRGTGSAVRTSPKGEDAGPAREPQRGGSPPLSKPYAGGGKKPGQRIVIDTETTGFGPRSEVVEVAIVDAETDEVLYDGLVLPEGPIPRAASAVHGLTRAALERLGAQPWPSHHSTVARILGEADQVLAYNADFDRRLLEVTAERYGLELPGVDWRCLMRGYADGGRWVKLAEACEREGIAVGELHRALADARLARALMLSMDRGEG